MTAWPDFVTTALLLALCFCIGAAGLQGLILGDKHRACRIHRWQRVGGALRCSRCKWLAGKDPPGDWGMGAGP
jgi:hypothetical protein